MLNPQIIAVGEEVGAVASRMSRLSRVKDTSFLAKDAPYLMTWMVLEMLVALDGHRLPS